MDVGGVSPDIYTKLNDVKPTDLWILLLGNTGTGKSRFINTLVSEEVQTDEGFGSVTATINIYPCDNLCDTRIWLVDTPAFDNDRTPGVTTVVELAEFLTNKYMRTVQFISILWFYRITDVRYQGSSARSLDLLSQLIGVPALPNLGFVTTNWHRLQDQFEGEQRQQALITGSWKFFVDHGSTFYALKGSEYEFSVRSVASAVVRDYRNQSKQLSIQREVTSDELVLRQTEIGRQLNILLQEQRESLLADWRRLDQLIKDDAATYSDQIRYAEELDWNEEILERLDDINYRYLSAKVASGQGELHPERQRHEKILSKEDLSGLPRPYSGQVPGSTSVEPLLVDWTSNLPHVLNENVYQDDLKGHTTFSPIERTSFTHYGTSKEKNRSEWMPCDTPEIVVAVMGITGCGKSSFVQLFTQDVVPISSGIESYTKEITMYRCSMPNMPKFFLIDTPGFDDTYRSDADVLRQLADFLSTMWSSRVMLAGIVYMHSIMDTRFGAAAYRNLGMFKKLCGDQAMSSVVLATTFWDIVELQTGAQREIELCGNERYWAGMIRHGSNTFRQDNGNISGTQILQHIISRRRHLVLSLQEELVDQGKSLPQTGAGQVVARQLIELRHEYEAELANLRAQHRQTLEQRDAVWQSKLEAMKKQYEAGISRQSQDVDILSATNTDRMSHQFDTSNISGNARAVLGNVTTSTQQTFYISNATLVFGDKGDFRGLKRPRKDSDDSNTERERIKSVLREFLNA